MAARKLLYRLRRRASLNALQLYTRDGHDQLITRNLGLSTSDIVVEFGSYLGDWSNQIHRRYGCNMHLFEPVPEFAAHLHHRFGSNPQITVHEVAIGLSERLDTLYLQGYASGKFGRGPAIDVKFESAEYLQPIFENPIALVSVNIEGGEYELIPALHAAECLRWVRRILIQFHPTGPDFENQKLLCRDLLSQSHYLEWSYDNVWESWAIRT